MRIHSVKLKNFRGYHEEAQINFNDLTVIVGKNDIGKSTILEALDIFFNDGKGCIKPDNEDLNFDVRSRGEDTFSISVEFSDLPKEIVIDSDAHTTLESEYLLNIDTRLEIKKIYSENGKLKATYIVAEHPSNENCSDLLTSKITDLRKILQIFNIECDNKATSNIIRKSIWTYFSKNLKLKTCDIPVDKEDAKKIWSGIYKILPTFVLFQSDRQNKDGDAEVQDPLKEATKRILKNEELQKELEDISEKVRAELKKVANATVNKLKKIDPAIANILKPEIPEATELKWADVFKSVSITGDEIPINKRGSGVRRLILLSFFMAEADRKNSDRDDGNDIIYGFEEPETSQHSDNQRMLITAFKKISEDRNKQVILTTHSGDILMQLDFENIIMLSGDKKKEITSIEPDQLCYKSLNEIDYIAFDNPTSAYHDELYSHLESKNLINGYLNTIRQKNYIEKNKDTGEPRPVKKIGLSKYIRHQIHHPDNEYNELYTNQELRESIDLTRKYISEEKSN